MWDALSVKKGHYVNKCLDAKYKEEKSFFKVWQLEDMSGEKDEKSIRQIKIQQSVILILSFEVYDLAGPDQDPAHPG